MNEESTEQPVEIVFVYGNARRGGPEAYRLIDAEYLSPAMVQGRLFKFSGRPALMLSEEGVFVTGNLYRMSAALLEEISPAESAASPPMRRIKAKVHPYRPGTPQVETWLWEWAGLPLESARVKEADWIEHSMPRQSPLLTLISLGCIFYPLLPMASWTSTTTPANPAIEWVVMGLALGAPLAGSAALVLAGKRREKWQPLRALMFFPMSAVVFGMTIAGVIAICRHLSSLG